MKVAPEVSSLDYTNSVSVQGVTIPGLSTRRVQTDVELESGQTFVIAGLLDNQTSDSLSKVPGIGSIPVLGKLFQQKQVTKNASELLVIITPEVVRPIPAGQPVPNLNFPRPFLGANTDAKLEQPGLDKTGPVPVKAADSVPVELLMPKGAPAPAMPTYQMVPVLPPAAPPAANPGLTPPPIGQQGGGSSK
jgi:pilus assembly protein CpaC